MFLTLPPPQKFAATPQHFATALIAHGVVAFRTKGNQNDTVAFGFCRPPPHHFVAAPPLPFSPRTAQNRTTHSPATQAARTPHPTASPRQKIPPASTLVPNLPPPPQVTPFMGCASPTFYPTRRNCPHTQPRCAPCRTRAAVSDPAPKNCALREFSLPKSALHCANHFTLIKGVTNTH